MKPKSYRVVIKKIKKAGFSLLRNTGGSHEVWWNESTNRTCTIPHHAEVKPGTLKSILKQIGIAEREFDKL